MTDKIVYKTEDIFEHIDSDGKHVKMIIPPEVSKKMGWKEGDVLRFTVEEGQIVVTKVEEKQE